MSVEKKPCILIVEDEQDVLMINARIMGRRGYEVLTAGTCDKAYELLNTSTPDLLILDIMLPDGTGYDICEYFREMSNNPVIFLTGKNLVADKIDALDKGCDYYITKPYDVDELLAIANRLLERHFKQKQKEKDMLVISKGLLSLDILKAKAFVDGVDTGLTSKEFALLLVLVQNEGKEMSLQELYERVWGTPANDDVRTIRTHMKNLRKKINADNVEDYDIVSNYGKGYVFTTFR